MALPFTKPGLFLQLLDRGQAVFFPDIAQRPKPPVPRVIHSSQMLKVVKRRNPDATPYSGEWFVFDIDIRGERLTSTQYSELLTVSDAGDEKEPQTISEVYRLGEESVLIESHGNGKVNFVRLDASSGRPEVERVITNGPGHQTMVLNTALPGWLWLKTDGERSTLLRPEPFAIYPVGEGDVVDVENGVAYLVVRPTEKEADYRLRAVSLANNGQDSTELALGTRCFAIPKFEERWAVKDDQKALPESKNMVPFPKTSEWRRRNLALSSGPASELKLRPDHLIAVPSRVGLDIVEGYRELRLTASTVLDKNAEPSYREEERDVVLLSPPDCEHENPQGMRRYSEVGPSSLQPINVAQFCLESHDVDLQDKRQRCGTPIRRKINPGSTLHVQEIRIDYRRSPASLPVEVTAYDVQGELSPDNKADPASAVRIFHSIRQIIPIGKDDFLATVSMADSVIASLYRIFERHGRINLVDLRGTVHPDFFPDRSADGRWLYIRSAGLLFDLSSDAPDLDVQSAGPDLVDIQASGQLYWDRGSYARSSRTIRWLPTEGNAAIVRIDCLNGEWEQFEPPRDVTLAQFRAWFDRNFEIVNGEKATISVRPKSDLPLRARGCLVPLAAGRPISSLA
ncbi:hypothetical protein CCZ27_08195 [Thauera sinica]|nr:hypothetical protein CCZ27_08195 [Thauera sp. K11]